MTTLGTMKTEILSDLRRSSTADTNRVANAISTAIKYYQPKRFFFNESRSVTFSTSASKSLYTFGTGNDIETEFYKIDMVVLEDTANDYTMKRQDYRELETLIDASSTSNRPYNYAYIDRALLFYPIPDAAYTMRIMGHIKYAEPAADGTAGNEWFTEAYEMIKARAKMYLYRHPFPDPIRAADMADLAREAMGPLMSATMDKTALGSNIPTDF